MPELSRFYGIVIKMFFLQSEHSPPHIHAIYGDYVGSIDIKTGEVLDGDLPKKAVGLIREWLDSNRNDVLKIWETQKFKKLPPLV